MVQTFWPSMIHSSPSRSARVCRLATSEPAPGSENIWHHTSSAEMTRARYAAFWAWLPYSASMGRHIPWEMSRS